MATTPTITTKGFIKDFAGNNLLPITRGELVLDADGNIALASNLFLAGTLKDSAGNGLPGLITAAERAMLTAGTNGESLSDLYSKLTDINTTLTNVNAKLQYINTGLNIGGQSYSFYNSKDVYTPIYITGTANLIEIFTNEDNNNILLSLSPINTNAIAVKSGVVKGIEVDEYGRVTSVTASDLTNENIPTILSGKTLTGCTTGDMADDEFAIVNKAYVDGKFDSANAVATGALKFGGAIVDLNHLNEVITDKNNAYHYYKVTASKAFTISANNTSDGKDTIVKVGDTLIVDGQNQIVYVPSGDEITTVTIKSDSVTTPIINALIGDILLRFSNIFSVLPIEGNPGGAVIALPPVTDNNDGYLTSKDYKRFNSYADDLVPIFTPSSDVENAEKAGRAYDIGTLEVSDKSYDIKGIKNIYSLNLTDKTVVEEQTTQIDPTIQLSENGTVVSSISYKGTNGIIVTKDQDKDVLQISLQANESTNSTYLSIGEGDDNNKFTINIGYFDEEAKKVVNGLASYEQLVALAARVALQIETIDYSLEPPVTDNGYEYHYGNDKLKAAIKLDTI